MKKQASKTCIHCEFFTWRLFRRDNVFYADGRSNRPNLGKHSLATRDRQEALTALRQLDRLMAVKHGLLDESAVPNSMPSLTVSAVWQRFLEHCTRPGVAGGVSENTLKRYRAVRDKHIVFCQQQAAQQWDAVTKQHAEQYGRSLARKGYADRTIYLELTLLVQITKWLTETKQIPETCRFSLHLRKPHGSDTYCYTLKQVDAILSLCAADPQLTWLGQLLGTLAMTGMRIAEAAALRWSDIDLVNHKIQVQDETSSSRKRRLGTVRTTKGKRTRTVPITPALHSILQGIPRHADGLVFHGPLGGRLKPDTVRNIFIRDVITPLAQQFPTPPGEIGFVHGRLHSFRHYFVSCCFANGASEGEVKDWVGHRDSAMVAHYRHLHDDVSRRRIQQITFTSVVPVARNEDAADGLPAVPPATPRNEETSTHRKPAPDRS